MSINYDMGAIKLTQNLNISGKFQKKKYNLLVSASLLTLAACASDSSSSDDDEFMSISAGAITPVSNASPTVNASTSALMAVEQNGSDEADTALATVTIEGIATEGQTLTVNSSDGIAASSYQWQRDGVDVDGATGTSYLLDQDDVGTEITVTANYPVGQDASDSVTSIATTPIADIDDALVGMATDGTDINSHSISDGVVSFDDADIFETALQISTDGDLSAALEYLQTQDLGDAGSSVSFDVGEHTVTFTQGDDEGSDALDVAVFTDGPQIDNLLVADGSASQDLIIL